MGIYDYFSCKIFTQLYIGGTIKLKNYNNKGGAVMITNSYISSYNYNNVIGLYKSAYQASPSNPLNIYNTKMFSGAVAKSVRAAMPAYLSQLNSAVSSLKTNLNLLGKSSITNSFEKKSVVSSNPGAVAGTAQNNADKASYTLNVTKLATGQTNQGKSLISNDNSVFSIGNNTFSIKVGNNEEKRITFSVSAGDTNKTSLTKMANSINFSRTGVTASVVSDTKTGTSYLKLNSDKTGTSNTFSINELNGNSIALSGADSKLADAQNAQYTLDGKQYSSETNTISLDNGKASVTLKKAEAKDFSFSIEQDTNAVLNDIKNFAADYNKVIGLAHTFSGTFNGTSKLEREFGSALNSKKASLANAGIYITSDSTIKIDEEKLKNTLKEDTTKVKNLFSTADGVSARVNQKANEVIASPLKYTYNTDFLKSYTNQKGQDLLNPNLPSTYSGMLFNMVL